MSYGTFVRIPAWISAPLAIARNPIRQILLREQSAEVLEQAGRRWLRLENGERARIASRRPKMDTGDLALLLPASSLIGALDSGDLTGGRWVGTKARTTPGEVLASLEDAFTFREADAPGVPGLRTPQLGALYAVLAHWTTRSSEPALIVMPTGTGKTETMLALLCASRLDRVLVVVPSDALRQQTARKFETLGVLQEAGVVAPTSLRPVVGHVRHGFRDVGAATEFADLCNVVITTPAALEASSA